LQECWVFRYTLEHNEIEHRLDKQQEWRENMRQRWPGSMSERIYTEINTEVKHRTHQMADFIRAIKDSYKLIIESRTMRIYTNDLELLKEIDQLDYVTRKRYSQVSVNRPKNTVALKNPQHKFRSYFRETRITREERSAIQQFLAGQTDCRIGQGLKDWLDEEYTRYSSKYTREYFFVDYDHASWLTMFNLVRPGLIRRTMDIIAK
jgi:hypothetical protein